MLTRTTKGTGRKGRSPGRQRKFWHRPELPTEPLGCRVCPDRVTCGTLRTKADFFDCLQFCCGAPAGCDRVCRNHPDFADRVREVGSFDLNTVRRGPALAAPELPRIVQLVYHRAGRVLPADAEAVAVPLYKLFDRREAVPRFTTPAALRDSFGVGPETLVMATGTAQDPPLERWWWMGERRRRIIIRAMKSAGVGIVTTPNYSLFTDRPRWDDMHAMMRIAIVHAEFLDAGMPAALHVNGRTETDFRRWTAFLAARPEITHIAYEFTTGTGWAGRREQHAAWLMELAVAVGRPLHLIVRGGLEVLPELAAAFAGLTVLESTTFMKTMMRQCAYPKGNAGIGWRSSPTAAGAPLRDLFAVNRDLTEAWLRDLIAVPQKQLVPG